MDNNINIIDIVKEISKNMSNIELINKIILDDKEKSNFTIVNEYIGICMLFAELNEQFPEENWDTYAHDYLSIIVKNIEQNGLNSPSLFLGVSGFGLTVYNLSKSSNNYKNLIRNINKYILKYTMEKIESISTQDNKPQDYDFIQGLSGILTYLLLFKDNEDFKLVIKKIISILIMYSYNHVYKGEIIPNFFVKSCNHMTKVEENMYPNGSFNTSFSHGISGIISSLSFALLNNINIEGQKEAIERLIEFLEGNKSEFNNRIFWKGIISLEEYLGKEISNEKANASIFIRDAWCYGVPGISLAYLYAGLALKNNYYINSSVSYLKQSFNNYKGIYSNTICHGYSGLLQIAISFKRSLKTNEFDIYIKQFKNKILNSYNKNNKLGFCNTEVIDGKFVELNSIGILDGITGTCLSLLDSEIGSKTDWKRNFLFIN